MTHLSDLDLLHHLGNGTPITSVCAAAGWSLHQFDAWWQEQCRQRVPSGTGPSLPSTCRIERDRWGVPHISANNDRDLFFAFGYAVAQDRLFQLDYLRRKARGRLAEILGPDSVESDIVYRTAGLARIAEAEHGHLPGEVRDLLHAYADGVNAWMADAGDRLPIEFALLDYRPEPWQPTDSLVVMGEFRWYLTVRLYVICMPELAKRALGDGPLYRDFVLCETDEESILHPGEYPTTRQVPGDRGSATGGEAGGSNNWVLAGSRTLSGKPLVASDPHVPFAAVSLWHEVVLRGGSFSVGGVALAGMPAVMIGRSRHMAWGITNNICSQRDLYQEKLDPQQKHSLHSEQWEPLLERPETIQVRGRESITHTVRSTRHGPLVDDLLPLTARGSGPVSLRWVGTEPCGWLSAMLGMNRARTCVEFREAARPWLCPTFNLVFADSAGHTGFQTVGKIPLRKVEERGYRPGWDPQHEWVGSIPLEELPHLLDPARGYVVTANNRLAPPDFPYPLSGRWATGYRCRRIRRQLEAKPKHTLENSLALQLDVHSSRAEVCLPHLLELLEDDPESRIQEAVTLLRNWDLSVTVESVPATIFIVFFGHWLRRIAAERIPTEHSEFVSAAAGGLGVRLLAGDPLGWFLTGDRLSAVREAFVAALDELTARLGPDMNRWHWGNLHVVLRRHCLSGRGDLGTLLDRTTLAIPGDSVTVNSSTPDGSYAAWLGASYRMVVDFSDPKCSLWAAGVGNTSGHPGSPHYDDQDLPWRGGEYRYIVLES